jgi:hypothetical protein
VLLEFTCWTEPEEEELAGKRFNEYIYIPSNASVNN